MLSITSNSTSWFLGDVLNLAPSLNLRIFSEFCRKLGNLENLFQYIIIFLQSKHIRLCMCMRILQLFLFNFLARFTLLPKLLHVLKTVISFIKLGSVMLSLHLLVVLLTIT